MHCRGEEDDPVICCGSDVIYMKKQINIGAMYGVRDEDSEIDGGVTRLTTGDLALRIFGHRAQKLQQVAEKIKKIYENERT